MSLIPKGLEQLGIPRDPEKEARLQLYMDELEFWNVKYGLVRVKDRRELEIRHLLDSLSGLPAIAESGVKNIADLGSGAGLPGIPLALYMPESHFTLVERSGRRCTFLENAVFQLGLKNVTIRNCDLKEVQDAFEMLTFRAFRPFEPEILKGIFKILPEGAILAAYKGRLDKTSREWADLKDLFQSGTIRPLKVPFLEGERNLLWMIR